MSSRSALSGQSRRAEQPAQVAMGDKPKYPGYTPQSGEVAAKRNCTAAGGKWVDGKCVGGEV